MVRGTKVPSLCGMAKGDGKKKRQPGNDESLPSGSIRVRVYAEIDPVTNTVRYLRETVPPGPDQEREMRQCSTDQAMYVGKHRR